jgi:hypothetical protein
VPDVVLPKRAPPLRTPLRLHHELALNLPVQEHPLFRLLLLPLRSLRALDVFSAARQWRDRLICVTDASNVPLHPPRHLCLPHQPLNLRHQETGTTVYVSSAFSPSPYCFAQVASWSLV